LRPLNIRKQNEQSSDELVSLAKKGRQKWLHNFGQGDEWNLCLTAGTVVPANQERL
jgi:hypothetical protein